MANVRLGPAFSNATLNGYEGLQRRFKALGVSQPLMRQLGLAVVREAKIRVPRKTGNLGRSIKVREATATNVVVEASANYAAFVEYGTRPHVITPRAKRALAFASNEIVAERFGPQKSSIFRLSGSLKSGAQKRFGNAAFVVVKRVNHPGTHAFAFLIPGAKAAARGVFGDEIVNAWNEAD